MLKQKTKSIKGQLNLFDGFGEEVCISITDLLKKEESLKETAKEPDESKIKEIVETTSIKYLCSEEHLQELFQKAKNIIISENFPLDHLDDVCHIDTKMSAWGRCKGRKVCGERFCSIFISPKLLETCEKSVMQTLLHEVLHATKNGNSHGAIWKSRAEQINRKYGYQIKTRNSPEELGVEKENMKEFYMKNYKYVLRCSNCGQIAGWKRMAKVIKYPDWFKCGCGGKLERIK